MATTPYRRVDQQGERRGVSDPSPTHQLDFYQAMADFRHMFPNLDEEVIEAVLRSNSGAVDATIDQLLTMNCDLGNGGERKKASSKGTSAEYKANQPILDSSSSGEEDAPPPYPPPSYHDYTNMVPPDPPPVVQKPDDPPPTEDLMSGSWKNDPMSWTNTTPSKPTVPPGGGLIDPVSSSGGSSVTDLLGAVGGAGVADSLHTTPKQPPSEFYGDTPTSVSPAHSPLKSTNQTPSCSGGKKRVWNPPLVGDLPDDFLRIVPTPAQQAAMMGGVFEGGALHAIRTNEGTPVGSGPNSPQVSDRRRSPRRSSSLHSRTGGASPASSRRLNSDMELLQQKLAENERRRKESISAGLPVHPEEAQILEDERFALMLQNEEFLHELQEDEDFMQTLENDHMNATAFEPPADSPELPADPDRPANRQLEGYGDDRSKGLEAFPFDRETVVVEQDKHAELKRKLKNMGGTSKKKLQAAARKFFTRKKKKPSKQLIKGTGMPSTINLLEEEHSDTEEILTSRSRSSYDQGD